MAGSCSRATGTRRAADARRRSRPARSLSAVRPALYHPPVFTVCPKCALTLAVTAADLRVGQGYVRCGRCASVFNALVALHEEAGPKEDPADAAADRRSAVPSPPPPPLMMEVPSVATDDATPDAGAASDLKAAIDADPTPDTMEFALGSADLAQIFVAPEVGEGETTSGTYESIVLEGDLPLDPDTPADPAADRDADEALELLSKELSAAEAELERIASAARDAVADPGSGTQQFEALDPRAAPPMETAFRIRAEDIDAFEEPERRSRSELWQGIAAGVLAVLLAAQLVHRFRNELARSPLLNAPLTSLYAALGAPLAPRWDPAALDVRQLGAVAEAGAANQLLVRASIRNEASRAQPMPLLRLTLQDRFGKRLASRDLTPREYLGERASERDFLVPGQRVDAEVAVVDPGRSAVGFEVDACLPNGTGGVACAGDARATR